MNVNYKFLTPKDAAAMLGLNSSTVSGWCNRGLINFTDISDKGSTVPRYQISENEVMHIKSMIKKYGKGKFLLYYKKDWDVSEKTIKEDYSMFNTDSTLIETCLPGIDKAPQISEQLAESVFKRATTDKLNPDKIMNTILYIQDIKERLEDIEAEKNQLLTELEECRKEVMEVL